MNDTDSFQVTDNSYSFEIFRIGTAIMFLIGIMLVMYLSEFHNTQLMVLIVSAMIGGYMAMNIGANDVANNVGPAVGSQALTLTGAFFLAVIFETAGALIAGGSVVNTIKSNIIDPQLIANTSDFIWLMMAALLSAALWLNTATYLGAPVSTTHSIVGGVLGAGIAAGGWDIANWNQVAPIASSWIISPVLGGLIAAGFLYFIKHKITYKKDKLRAAKKIVPLLVMLMTWMFSSYLIIKGMKNVIHIEFFSARSLGLILAVAVYYLVRPLIERSATRLSNSKQSINQWFTIPLIVSAALLSLAHGANDVEPLAAINDSISNSVNVVNEGVPSTAGIPFWMMILGAGGIALGLILFGSKLIKTVGSEITDLDKMRAFCIAMSAAITIIIATHFGLPVSSTQIAIGAIFGIGFLRESIKSRYDDMEVAILHHYQHNDAESVAGFLQKFRQASVKDKRILLQLLERNSLQPELSKKERKRLTKFTSRVLVKRSALYRIAVAWVITVPASGLVAALLFFTIRGVMLP